MKKVFWGSVIVLFLLQTEVVVAMSLIGFKVCLASEMKATVIYEGKPVADAVVTRVVRFNDKDYTTEARTDAQGRFVLPSLYERTLWKHTKFVVFIDQRVSIAYEGENHLALELTKQNFDYDGELNNPGSVARGYTKFVPYEFTCELTHEMPERHRHIEGTGANFGGKCINVTEIIYRDSTNKG